MKRGFTLIELVIYVAVVGLLFSMIVSLFFAISRARVKGQGVAEVEQQGYAAMEQMTQAVRNAKGINSPAPGASASSLSITTYLSSTSPTVFSLSGGALTETDGVNAAAALTGGQIVVSNLSFQNLAASSTDGSIKIQFTVSQASSTGSNTNYTATFYGSASVRDQQ